VVGREREFFIDNLLVRIHFIIVMIRWTGLAPWEFKLVVGTPVVRVYGMERAATPFYIFGYMEHMSHTCGPNIWIYDSGRHTCGPNIWNGACRRSILYIRIYGTHVTHLWSEYMDI